MSRLPFGIGDFVATFKGDFEGHPFRGNQFEGGSGDGEAPNHEKIGDVGIVEISSSGGMRPQQYKFQKNRKIMHRVVGKGSMFSWGKHGELPPGQSPHEWLVDHDRGDYKVISNKEINEAEDDR